MWPDVMACFSASRFSPSSRSSRIVSSLISRPSVSTRASPSRRAALQVFQQAQHFAKFALHRERALGALLAASDSHVVEAFSRRSEEERIGIFEREIAARARVADDVAVAKLGQDDFQRLAQSHRAPESCSSAAECCWLGGAGARALVHQERELRLRILRMDQERGPAIDIGAQQTHAFVGRVPRLHDDVVQFVAQEVFDNALVMRFDFEKIGQHADRGVTALQRARLKQAAYRFGGISVLGDDGFE